MKAILLSLLAIGAFALTGCETTVVEHRPGYHRSEVYYSSGRPYYYTGGVRYWGYPSGYRSGYGYGYRSYGYRDYGYRPSYHRSYSQNVEVERNTYVVNNNRRVINNRTVVVNRNPTPTYRSQTNVQVKKVPPGQAKKKKKVYTY